MDESFLRLMLEDHFYIPKNYKLARLMSYWNWKSFKLEGDFQLQLTTKPTSPETASEFLQISLGGFVQGSVVCF